MPRIMLKDVRLSYCNVWEPKSVNGSEPKYSTAIIIDKTDVDNLNKIYEAVEQATAEGKAKFWKNKIPSNLKLPLRDGDTDMSSQEAYINTWFLNANSKNAPNIVDNRVLPILDTSQVYSGCYCNVSITIYPFNNQSKGIAVGLGNIQKIRDGKRLDGMLSAEDEFSAEDGILD